MSYYSLPPQVQWFLSGTHSANVTCLCLSSPVGMRTSAAADLTGPPGGAQYVGKLLGALFACVEIGFDLLPMAQVIGTDSINIRQCRGGVALRWSRTLARAYRSCFSATSKHAAITPPVPSRQELDLCIRRHSPYLPRCPRQSCRYRSQPSSHETRGDLCAFARR